MIITPLGHTEFLVDIANSEGRNVRILVDGWLSDYALGDLMERTVKVKLDTEKLSSIDALYISHAHCDHFDPYTLIEIYGGVCHCEERCATVGSHTPECEHPTKSVRHMRGVSNPGSQNQSMDCHVESHGNSDSPRNDGARKPLLMLPFTLRYLEGLIREYLPSAEVVWLEHRKPHILHGIEITGYMWANPVITNEDDVMMLAISSERELVFAEIDTVPDMEDEGVQKSLYKVFTRKDYETSCYLASRNCLEGQIPYYDILPEKRKAFRDQYIATQKEEIAFQYERYEYEEFAHHPNLYALPGFVRGFIGQGIAYPSTMSEELYALALFPLDELVSIESDYAKNAGYSFPQKALTPGRQYKVENGGIEVGRKECLIGELVKNEEGRVKNTVFSSGGDSRSREILGENSEQDLSTTLVPRFGRDDIGERLYASGPLFPRELSESEILEGKKKILEILNTRFLPYWSASPVASLRDTLIKNNGVYRVELKTLPLLGGDGEGTPPSLPYSGRNLVPEERFLHTQEGHFHKIIFEYSTATTGFIEVLYKENMYIDEDYWFLDVLDFLEGKLEMYSSFWHVLDPKKIYRLWTCLGANFCNNELGVNKYRYHFEQAKAGKTAREFVEAMLKNI